MTRIVRDYKFAVATIAEEAAGVAKRTPSEFKAIAGKRFSLLKAMNATSPCAVAITHVRPDGEDHSTVFSRTPTLRANRAGVWHGDYKAEVGGYLEWRFYGVVAGDVLRGQAGIEARGSEYAGTGFLEGTGIAQYPMGTPKILKEEKANDDTTQTIDVRPPLNHIWIFLTLWLWHDAGGARSGVWKMTDGTNTIQTNAASVAANTRMSFYQMVIDASTRPLLGIPIVLSRDCYITAQITFQTGNTPKMYVEGVYLDIAI